MSATAIRFATRLMLAIALSIAFIIAWGNFHQNEDLIMALLAGRDVVQGNLAQPDQWSFTTHGRIWVNQGWLSGLLFFLSYTSLQELGPVLLKGILLAACLVPVYVRCRTLRVSPEVSFLAMTVGMMSVATLISVRAENFAILYFVLLTMLLTVPCSPGILRHVASLGLILIWCNSHGSFLIGFGLIGVKAVAQFFRHKVGLRFYSDEQPGDAVEPEPASSSCLNRGEAVQRPSAESHSHWDGQERQSEYRTDALKWALTWLCCVPVMAFANPYGISNLTMPFRQTSAVMWTATVDLWQPLVQFGGNSGLVLYMGKLSLFYLLSLVLLVVVAIAALQRVRLKQALSCLMKEDPAGERGDLLMEILITSIMIALTFRFGRTIVFTGFALVPTMAFVMQHSLAAPKNRLPGKDEAKAEPRFSRILLIVSAGIMVFAMWIFSIRTLPPYLPNNPLFQHMSIVRRAFGTPWELDNLTSFMKNNRITGRIFSDLLLSDVLLLHARNVTVFMDLRAQNMYSDETCRDYLTVALVDRQNRLSIEAALKVLDRYAVSAIALPTDNEYWIPLISVILNSSKWQPVYVDTSGFVFLRTESQKSGSRSQLGQPKDLWYPGERSRLLTRAYLMLSSKSGIPPHLETELKNVAKKRPANLVYRVLAASTRGAGGCMSEESRSYFLSEFKRLSSIGLLRSGAYQSVLGSMVEILNILMTDSMSCLNGQKAALYREKSVELARIIDRIHREYSPWPSE